MSGRGIAPRPPANRFAERKPLAREGPPRHAAEALPTLLPSAVRQNRTQLHLQFVGSVQSQHGV